MFKLFRSNLREIVIIAILFSLVLYGSALLADRSIAANGPLSELVSLVASVLSGVFKFAVCLALAWFGLAITFPEAGGFAHGSSFDDWWFELPHSAKGYVAVAFAAVLLIVAGLCMAH